MLHRLPGKYIALDEHLIDLVNGVPPVAGRMAGPEWQGELQIRRCLPPFLPADETFGLARQVFKG